jgi:hypothetical protein
MVSVEGFDTFENHSPHQEHDLMRVSNPDGQVSHGEMVREGNANA